MGLIKIVNKSHNYLTVINIPQQSQSLKNIALKIVCY